MKLEVNIPESLNEITLEQYQKYYKLVNENEPSEFVNQKTIEILCNIDLLEVVKIKYSSIIEITDHLNKLFESKPKLITNFELGGKKFGFIPDLENITYGEFMDLDGYLSNVGEWDKAMSVLYRPITKSYKNMYDIEKYEITKYSDVMKYAPMDVVISATVFFYNLSKELSIALANCLESLPMEVQQTIQQKVNLLRSGDGINHYTPSHKEMFSDLMQCLT